jgi:phosphodiesterase/alkaline phosphatase D-like protein
MLSRFVSLLLLAGVLPAAAADTVIGGPFVVNNTGRAATVVWIVQSDQVVVKAQGAAERSIPALHSESITLNGLRPATVYEYSVPGKDNLKGSFKTPPAAGQPFEFVLYGDNRTRPDVHRKVVETILKVAKPDFILQTGDMVENGADNSLWPIFFDIERELLRKVSFYPTLGNHEHNMRQYYDFFQVPAYYSFTWGNAHFTMIDSDLANVSTSETARQAFWKEQTSWLEDDLRKNQNADFRFVIAHHPPMTAVESRQGANPHMTALIPLFEQMHVTAALFGHDHNYQHYLKDGIHYIISGGGGAPLYDVNKPPAGITQKVVSTENFLRIRAEGKVMHVDAIDGSGEKIESFDFTAK